MWPSEVTAKWRCQQTVQVPLRGCPWASSAGARSAASFNSDVEADEALGRCAPSGPRSLTPVVGQMEKMRGFASLFPCRAWMQDWGRQPAAAARESVHRFADHSDGAVLPTAEPAADELSGPRATGHDF